MSKPIFEVDLPGADNPHHRPSLLGRVGWYGAIAGIALAVAAFLVLVGVAWVNDAHAGERPELPPLHQAKDLRGYSGGIVLVFDVHHQELEATFATVPSFPLPHCDGVVLVARNQWTLAERSGKPCVYRIVPEPVQWRWSLQGGDFEAWEPKTFHPLPWPGE